MIEVNMPQDIMKYKTKFVGNFSLREAVCIALGMSVGLFCWFNLFANLTQYPRMILTATFVLPFFVAGFFKPLGMTAEKALTTVFVDNFIAPAKRKYEVHHSEYEKFVKYQGAQSEGAKEESTEKKSKKTTGPKNEQKLLREVKIKPSKQFKAVR